ncbi:MAG: GNAT family N-acetyltransferase [Ilumatobacter sp.]|uniref:GNAT family N-acetyltransferase n=1 Tax=Ilumatobacter sp. TaxID=1967498 RepID=UPI00329A473E
MLDRDGTLLGAVDFERLAFDRFEASAFVSDPKSARAIAGLVNRHAPSGVAGSGDDVTPLVAGLVRARAIYELPVLRAEAPIGDVLGVVESRTRMATLLDLDELVEHYRNYDLNSVKTIWQLRQLIRHRLTHQSIAICRDDEGVLVGACMMSALTRRYGYIDALSVLPEARSGGVGTALLARFAAYFDALGVGGFGAIAPSNPMRLERDGGIDRLQSDAYRVALRRRHRFRGHGRLRKLVERIGPIESRPVTTFRAVDITEL